MGRFVETTVIPAEIDRVFDYRLNVLNLPEYNPKVSDLRALSDGPPEEGSTYAFRVKVAPTYRASVKLTIVRVERPHVIEFSMESILDAREICTFETFEGGTRLRLEMIVDTPGGRLAPIVDALFALPTARRQVCNELALIKANL